MIKLNKAKADNQEPQNQGPEVQEAQGLDKNQDSRGASEEASSTASENENDQEAAEGELMEDFSDEMDSDNKKILELTDRLQRTMAEFDNFRKRTTKEKAAMYDYGVKETIEKFLPVIDNFERSLTYSDAKESSFYKGIELILRQLEGALDFIGVETIDCIGKEFDPNLHNAVAHVEDKSAGQNQVVEVLQKGYKYKGNLIRPSMVKVAN